MSKTKTIYECQNCGAQYPKWMGRCTECGRWNTLVEEVYQSDTTPTRSPVINSELSTPTPLSEISTDGGRHISLQIGELDRVMGGGFVPGSLVLIGGDPGIGKSTIILQALGKVSNDGQRALYISGEESQAQIKLRAERLGLQDSTLNVITENCLERIIEEIKKFKPDIITIDSIQTVYSNNIQSAPGTISQVRESASQLLYLSKSMGCATFLIGHITKEGTIAGPKALEHMVDTVLYFEGERGHSFRILRSVKNRFGSTNEIGVFEMTDKGLKEVPNPSELFLSERPIGVAGSVVTSSLEGSRPVLLELQALVSETNLGNPRRTSIGVDNGRVALLVAVLEKIVGISLHNQDIYINVAGGIRSTEPAIDLSIITGIYSSFRNIPIDQHTVIIGEVGLTGEVRAVSGIDRRLNEAEKMGFTKAIIPKGSLKAKQSVKIEAIGVSSVEEAINLL
ncbi:DNA repair protein RadA [bacterium]|nr:DNA repair protein RadA [bacterium]